MTICSWEHKCIFGSIVNGKMNLNEKGRIVDQCWKEILENFPSVNLDEYVIMPNHVHGIIIINEIDMNCCRGEVTSPLQKTTLGNIAAYFKCQSTKLINELQVTPGVKIWQRSYYDRIIRNNKELQNIRDYIDNNVLAWAFDKENPENIPL